MPKQKKFVGSISRSTALSLFMFSLLSFRAAAVVVERDVEIDEVDEGAIGIGFHRATKFLDLRDAHGVEIGPVRQPSYPREHSGRLHASSRHSRRNRR
jgi:hypothetical protein